MAATLQHHSPGVTRHIKIRARQGKVYFSTITDYRDYLDWLQGYAARYRVAVHAWVLMPDHVHLLVTPATELGIAQLLGALGTHTRRHLGGLGDDRKRPWQAGARSCPVSGSTWQHYLQCYIELNPVRRGLVEDAGDYHWSSSGCTALGRASGLFAPHRHYLALGRTPGDRQRQHGRLIQAGLPGNVLEEIRRSTFSGRMPGGGELQSGAASQLVILP